MKASPEGIWMSGLFKKDLQHAGEDKVSVQEACGGRRYRREEESSGAASSPFQFEALWVLSCRGGLGRTRAIQP